MHEIIHVSNETINRFKKEKNIFENLTALLERISSQSLRTEAYWIAIIVLAHRVQTARVWNTWIRGHWRATNVRFSLKSDQTFALCLMILRITARIQTAIRLQARVDALPVETVAIFIWWTVLIILTYVSTFFLWNEWNFYLWYYYYLLKIRNYYSFSRFYIYTIKY